MLSGLNLQYKLLKQRLPHRLQHQKLRIGYIGAQDYGNAGDYAMYEAITGARPDCRFFSMSYAAKEKRLQYLGLSGPGFFNMALLGGGTLINPHWLHWVEEAHRQQIPLAAAGTGVGSAGFRMAKEVDLSDWTPLLRNFVAIGVRGERSKKKLESLGLNDVQVVGDPALALTPDEYIPPANQNNFLLNLTYHHRSDFPSIDNVIHAIEVLTGKGWNPILFATDDRDFIPMQECLQDLEIDDTIHRIRCFADFQKLVQTASFCISVRLHGAVLSCCLGLPTLMLGYREKCLEFMESMNLGNWHFDIEKSESDQLNRMCEEICTAWADLSPSIHAKALQWKKKYIKFIKGLQPK